MRSSCLVDTTRCIGCRSCQVACKQSKRLGGTRTRFFAAPGGYQNPRRFTPTTFTYISYHETEAADGEPAWAFVKHQCMHCTDLYCAVVCAPQVFHKTESGVVAYQADNCIGCGACVGVCPFEVPTIDYWDVATPHMRKCSFCLERQESEIEKAEIDGKPLSGSALGRHEISRRMPACAKACPTEAIRFGDRGELLAEAKRRIAAKPRKYVDHVYGETEAGGTGWLYLASVPFEDLGFPTSFEHLNVSLRPEDLGENRRSRRRPASVLNCFGLLAAGISWFFKRRDEVRNKDMKTLGGKAPIQENHQEAKQDVE